MPGFIAPTHVVVANHTRSYEVENHQRGFCFYKEDEKYLNLNAVTYFYIQSDFFCKNYTPVLVIGRDRYFLNSLSSNREDIAEQNIINLFKSISEEE